MAQSTRFQRAIAHIGEVARKFADLGPRDILFERLACGAGSRDISATTRDNGEAIGSLASVGARHGLLLRWAMGVTVSKRWLAGSAAAAPCYNHFIR